jgi:hypothetical protein
MNAQTGIRPRERDSIIQALQAGVVPRLGLRHIQVGRASEVAALLRDIDRVSDGGASVRFIIGAYGAGKTFFVNLVRLIALERKCVTSAGPLFRGAEEPFDAHQARRKRARERGRTLRDGGGQGRLGARRRG